MDQYNKTTETSDKPRIKLPLVKSDAESRINDLERMFIHHTMLLEKLHKKTRQLETELEQLRNFVKKQ